MVEGSGPGCRALITLRQRGQQRWGWGGHGAQLPSAKASRLGTHMGTGPPGALKPDSGQGICNQRAKIRELVRIKEGWLQHLRAEMK